MVCHQLYMGVALRLHLKSKYINKVKDGQISVSIITKLSSERFWYGHQESECAGFVPSGHDGNR